MNFPNVYRYSLGVIISIVSMGVAVSIGIITMIIFQARLNERLIISNDQYKDRIDQIERRLPSSFPHPDTLRELWHIQRQIDQLKEAMKHHHEATPPDTGFPKEPRSYP